MEKDIQVGAVGISIKFSGGKAVISESASVDGGAVGESASITCDAGMLIDQIQAAVEKAAPVTAPIDPLLFGALKQAVVSIP